jgi:hypothetical protein
MNLSIYKFPFKVTDYQKISMPKGARILSAQTQNEFPCIWAICDAKTEEKEEREFEVFGTGNPFYENSYFGKEHKFIATFQLNKGSFVGHLFELVEIVA